MLQTTLTGKELPEDEEENNFWAEGSFAETMSSKDWELKKRTFHMKHNEEMNYNCKQCNTKTLRKANFSGVPKMRTFLSISAHNKDWHARRITSFCAEGKHIPSCAGRYDKCFDKMLEENEVNK